MKNRSVLLSLVLPLFLAGCSTTGSGSHQLPDKLMFTRPNLYPEGIAFRADREEFLVTSLRLGEIGAVSRQGTYTKLVDDPDLLSVIGIKYDAKNRRILACNSHPGATSVKTDKAPGSVAQLMVYGSDGTRQGAYDLAALRPGVPHFCNDMAVDGKGNVYVTDSFAPVIYRVTQDGQASVFMEHPAFASPDPGKAFGLNGIVFHPDGYLLVNHMALGKLLKVDLASRSVEEVGLERPIEGADGMVLINTSALAVVQNGLTGGPKQIVRLVTQDGWRNASLSGTSPAGEVTPTTAAVAGSQVYAIDARLSELFDGKGPRSSVFAIHKAEFR